MTPPANQIIQRHKTAIRRHDLSLPVKCLVRDELIDQATTVFDYGCGHGENIALLNDQGIACRGWDPVYRPSGIKANSDVVNLGYVINVIEHPEERTDTLREAWGLSDKLLVVSAQIQVSGRGLGYTEFGDGVVTKKNTFQKYYTQAELREYLESTLKTDALPAAIGIFYLFKDEELKQQYVANRYRRRFVTPRKRISELQFEQNQEILEPFMATITDLGRLPFEDEVEGAPKLIETFGSLKRAFTLVKRVTGAEAWDNIGAQRREDIVVYLALARFGKRPPLTRLPLRLQRDIRKLYGSYKKTCRLADALLFLAGDEESIDESCRQSPVGKLLPNALYVHKSAVDALEPLLRVYEGCARAYLGEIEDTNLVKLHRFSGKVSYLAYPDFEKNPHPTLTRSVKLNLRNLDLECYDYTERENPPILHRKETFLREDHPLHERFARLTRQEEKNGLLDNSRTIGTKNGWNIRLDEAGFTLRGHCLVRKK